MLFLLLSCHSSGDLLQPICDPQILVGQEIRARYLGCSDELLAKGHGRRGDLVIENSRSRWVFRTQPISLTHRYGGGFQLIDAAPPEQNDGLFELLPMLNDEPLRAEFFSVQEANEGITLSVEATTESGLTTEVHYFLAPDSSSLALSGAESWSFTPLHDWQEEYAVFHHHEYEWLYGVELGLSNELEGAHHLHISSWSHVHQELRPDTKLREGESDGEWVVIDEHALPVVDEGYSGHLPDGPLVAQNAGCLEGDPTEEDPMVGACGSVLIRAQEEDGTPLTAEISSGEKRIVFPKEGARIPLPPSSLPLSIWAGYAHEYQILEREEAVQEYSITLRRAIPESYLLLFKETAFPQTLASDPIPLHQASHTIMSTREQVPLLSDQEKTDSTLDPAAWSGGILAWPWYAKLNKAALGITPKDLSAEEQLIFAAKSGRQTAISSDWLEDAEAPSLWPKRPDYMWIEQPEELDDYMNLLSEGVYLTPLSKVTWIHIAPDRSWTAAQQAARAGELTVGNGPWVKLSREEELILQVAAPEWMLLNRAEIWLDGVLWQELELEQLPLEQEFSVPSFSWAVARVYGVEAADWLQEPAWAISGAVLDTP